MREALEALFDSVGLAVETFATARQFLDRAPAEGLGTSEIMVKVHRARVMGKMRAHSLVELARFADRLATLP